MSRPAIFERRETKMTKAGRRRRKIEHQMPEVDSKLTGRAHGRDVYANVVSLEDGSIGILFNGKVYRSMSAAAIAAANYSVDGWRFWKKA